MSRKKRAEHKSPLSFFGLRRSAEHAAGNLPALLAAADKAARDVMTGEHAQRRAGTGNKFWQFREYNAFDRPQDIDWRQSAKNDRIYVRQKEQETVQSTFFWCQRDLNMDFSSSRTLPSKGESAMIMTLALCMLLTRGGEKAGLAGGSVPPGRGTQTVEKIGRFLTSAPDRSALPGDHLSPLPRHAGLIAIGDFLQPVDEIKSAISRLAGQTQNVTLLQVLDPAELTLAPYHGHVIFDMPDRSTQQRIDNVETIRHHYIANLTAHQDALKTLCRHYGWHYMQHVTHDDPRKTLFALWHLLSHGQNAGMRGTA